MSSKSGFDVFIAFHIKENNDELSSYNEAKKVYDILTSKKYNCYMREKNAIGAFDETWDEASRSKLFLLVANEYIDEKCEDKILGNGDMIRILKRESSVFNELKSGFMSQHDGKPSIAKKYVQCYCYSVGRKINDRAINNLHPCFEGMVPKHNIDETVEWVEKTLSEYCKKRKDTKKSLWTKDMAKIWHDILPPSKPSDSELNVYEKYFEIKRKESDNPKVLILGTTIEYIKLAKEYSCEFNVVDSSQEYFNEITETYEIECDDELVICDWTEMDTCDDLEKNSYDIVIGDLAVGNVCPGDLEKVIKNISSLLKEKGYWLGKSVYSFTKCNVLKDNIRELFCNYTDDKPPYQYTMYDLAIYAYDKKTKKLDFGKIYKVVKEECEGKAEVKNIYEEYCGPERSYDSKMKLDFYIHSIKELTVKTSQYLTLIDTEYGNDIYSRNFPLLIFCKTKIDTSTSIKDNINMFLQNELNIMRDYKQWAENIPTQYFLMRIQSNLKSLVNNRKRDITDQTDKTVWGDVSDHIASNIKDKVILKLVSNLRCALDDYPDAVMDKEAKSIERIDDLNLDDAVALSNTYKYAVLCYISTKLDSDFSQHRSFFHIVKDVLFKCCGEYDYWPPAIAPWLTSKVCLSLSDSYGKLDDDIYKSKINKVISKICSEYIVKDKHDWDCGVGNHLDTRALNIEVLLDYYDVLWNKRDSNSTIRDSIYKVLSTIHEQYIANGQIYETLIKNPIGDSIFDAVFSNTLINRKSPYKKMLGRIEFLSALLRVDAFIRDNRKTEAYSGKENAILELALRNFWYRFKEDFNELYVIMNDTEMSSMLQIMYSLQRAFMDNCPDDDKDIKKKRVSC